MLPLKLLGISFAFLIIVIADNSAESDKTKDVENQQVKAIIEHLNENPNTSYLYKEGQYVNSQSKVKISFFYC